MTKVLVIGGGISGLGAAWRLKKAGVEATVLEAEDIPGGRMKSIKFGETWIDCGAENLGSSEHELIQATKEIGLGEQMFEMYRGPIEFGVKRGDGYHDLKMDHVLGFFKTSALSWQAKARLPLLLPATLRQAWKLRAEEADSHETWRGAWADDQSIEEWLSRLNPEFLEYFLEPYLHLMCGWEAEEVSKGFFLCMNALARGALSYTFPEALGQVPRTLAKHLDVRTGCKVEKVRVGGARAEVEWSENGQSQGQEADGVIVSVQGPTAADLINGLDDARRGFLRDVPYVPQGMIFLRLSQEAPELPKEDLYFPRSEDDKLISLTYRAYHTNPGGEKLFRISARNSHVQAFVDKDDDAFLDWAQNEAARYAPEAMQSVTERYVARWRRGIPVFPPGYLRALDKFMHAPPVPGLAFAGDYLSMPSTGAAFRTGLKAADDLMKRLAA